MIHPYKLQIDKNDRKITLFMVLGLILMTTLAVILGIVVHFGLSIAMIVIYILSMIFIVRKLLRENDRL